MWFDYQVFQLCERWIAPNEAENEKCTTQSGILTLQWERTLR